MKSMMITVAIALIAIPMATLALDEEKPKIESLNIYPLDTCAVAKKKKLGSMGDPVVFEVEGREIRLCCIGCKKKIVNDPAKYFATIDERIIAQQKPNYPLTTCLVAGEKLDSDAVDVVVNHRLIRTCCKNCARKVKSFPGPYLERLDLAIVEKQAEKYPLTICAVSGEPLDKKSFDIIVGNQLVRLCCKGCKRGLKKDPVAPLAAVSEGWKAGKKEEKKSSP